MLTIIEIVTNELGSHNNHTADYNIPIPEGWAILPSSVGTPDTLENFPFGEITVDESTPPVVTSWTPGIMPNPAPVDPEPTADELMDILLGVTE